MLEPIYVIILVTFGLSALIRVLQRKLVNRRRLKELQKQVKEDQKKYFELVKEAEKNKKEIEEINPRMMKAQMEMMNAQMKVSLITLPVFLAVLFFLNEWFVKVQLVSPIPVVQFTNWWPVGLTTTPGYYEAYITYSILTTIICMGIERVYDSIRHPEIAEERKKEKEEEKKKKEMEKAKSEKAYNQKQ